MAKPASQSPATNGTSTSEQTSSLTMTNGNGNGNYGSMNGSHSPTNDVFDLQVPKLSSLRGNGSELSLTRPSFGRSTSVAFEGRGTIHDFLKTLKNERFRHMPHDGSNWDKVLKWAEDIGGVVLLSHGVLDDFMLNSGDATRLICDSCISLIRNGSNHITALLKVFSVFHKMAFALAVFLRQKQFIKSTSSVRRELAHAYSVFAHLTYEVNEYCKIKAIRYSHIDMRDFDASFGSAIESFYIHLEHVSTSMWTSQKQCSKFDIHAIRDFLSPQDTVVKTIMSNQLYADFHRAEFTCEWFGPHLKGFTNSKGSGKNVFLVSGDASTGKTVLARWIYEKLQASIDDNRYDIISFSVDTNVRYTTSSLNLVKSLLLQVIDRKIGHECILEHISEAMRLADNGKKVEKVEEALWAALEASFDHGRTLILIDGLDQLTSARIGNPPQLETLHRITKARSNVKAIVLTRPVSEKALQYCSKTLNLQSQEEFATDIHHYIEHKINSHDEYRYLKETEKHDIVQKLSSHAADRSYLWAELQLQSIKREKSVAGALKICQTAPKTSGESLDMMINALNPERSDTKRILSWVMAAERPLTLKEVKALLEVDLDGCAYRPLSGDVEKIIQDSCGKLLIIRDELLYLRHPTIRSRLSGNSGKLAIDLKEAHRELSVRSMAYVKIHIYGDTDPQSDLADSCEVASQFNKYHLLEYATRYWIFHFRSAFCDKKDNFTLSAAFKICFSNSVRLALLEGTCLARQYIISEAESLQNLAYRARKTLFGENSPAVLQSLILELRLGKKFKDTLVLGQYSFEAWKISRHICGPAVVQRLAENFIEYTLRIKISEHSEFCSRKEEVLKYLIHVLKSGHHETKEIRYMRMLADFYIETHQVEKAVVIYRELYSLRLKVFGHLHEDTLSLYEILILHLKSLSQYEEVLEITLEYHEYLEKNISITDERRIKSTLTIIKLYEERHEVFRAEEILVRYWKAVSTEMKTTRVTELKIDFGLKYSKFLLKHSRKEESEVILRGLWTEVQSYKYESRFESTMITRMKKIAKYFSKLEIYSMSRSIYQSLYRHYEKTEQRTSTECITIVQTLAETITKSITYYEEHSSEETFEERTEETIEESSTVITTDEKSTLIEVFESSMSSTEITSTTISICKALTSIYIKEERYTEACEIYVRVISKVWESIESSTTIIEISEHNFTTEIFELALSLAYCRFESLQIEIAETIYWNVFRALIRCTHIDREYLLKQIIVVIGFFEKIYKYERVIEIYRELFVWMPICFGKKHHRTIHILFAFAKVCFRMRLYKEAATACYYIYSCFHIEGGCIDRDGWEAALLLVRIYEIECRWDLAYEVYGFIWRTFLHYGSSYKLDVTIIESIYSKYVFILREKKTVEYHVLVQIAREYRETCRKFYGHRSEITIKATLEYAHICSTREEHYEESITLYNGVIEYCKETKSTFSSKISHTCKKSLATVYSYKKETVSKAVEIFKEQYEIKKRTERTSKETISTLKSLVSTYKKQSTTQSTLIATQTLKSSVMEIFQEESRFEKLIESAKSIAEIYKECSYTEQATTLIQEMRSKVIEEVRKSVTTSTKVSQKSYVFLASFQETISESYSFSSVIAELRSEIMMYESYFKATRTQTDFQSIIKSGSRLYFHVKKSKRSTEFVQIQKELTEYFLKYLKFSRQISHTSLHLFFRIYLEECNRLSFEHTVVQKALKQLYTFTKTTKFTEAYDLALLIDKYIHVQGGFHCEFYIRTGFEMAKYLVGIGTNRAGDEKLYGAMLELSRTVLMEALEGLEKIDMKLDELSDLLVDVVRLLSEQKKYDDLERILQTLWRTRTIHATLPPALVLWLGRCLIQTLASLNKFPAAIHLCHDIRYNLSHVRGPLDKSTLEFTILLSELYTETKRYKDAMALHAEVLSTLAEPHHTAALSSSERINIAATHTEYLKKAYQRNGKFDKNSTYYAGIFENLEHRFGNDKTWASRRPPPVEKWSAGGLKEGDHFGCWHRPGRFEWVIEGEERDEGLKGWEELVRKRSGNWAGFFDGGVKELEPIKVY